MIQIKPAFAAPLLAVALVAGPVAEACQKHRSREYAFHLNHGSPPRSLVAFACRASPCDNRGRRDGRGRSGKRVTRSGYASAAISSGGALMFEKAMAP